MTTSPSAASAGSADALYLSDLVNRVLTDRMGNPVGRLVDVIVQRRGNEYPLVTGLVAAVGGRKVFIPAGQLIALDGSVLRLGNAKIDMHWFGRREGEVLLRADILGRRLVDAQTGQLMRAADLKLAAGTGSGFWEACTPGAGRGGSSGCPRRAWREMLIAAARKGMRSVTGRYSSR